MIGQAWRRETRDGTGAYVAIQGASEQGSAWGRLEAAVRLRGEKKRGPWEGLACWGELGATAALSAKGQVRVDGGV